MATTWTCADGHTHDASKPGRNKPFSIAATLDIECKTCGDRITDCQLTSNTPTPTFSVVHVKLRHSDNAKVDI